MRSLSLLTLLFSIISYGTNLTIGSSDTTFCEGDSILLEASSGFFDYEWNTGDEGRLLWVKQGGTYIIQAEDNNANLHYDTIVITKFEVADLNAYYAPSSGVICEGDSFVVEVSEGFEEYWWNTGHSGDRNVLYLERSKTVVVEAIDSNGCEARVEFELEVRDCDSCSDLIEVWPDSVSCEGDSIKLLAKEGFDVYEWHDGVNGRYRWVDETGWYVLTAEHEDGYTCTDSVYIAITEGRELNAYYSPSSGVICEGDSFIVELSEGFEEYWWNTGHSGDRNVLYLERSKTVVVEAIDSNGCEARVEFELEVKDCDTCSDLIEVWPDSVSCEGDSIKLLAKEGFDVYEWHDGVNGRYRWVDETGWYVLTAEHEDGYTCTDSVYIVVTEGRELEAWASHEDWEMCIGDSIVIELNGGFTQYWWSTGHRGDRVVLYPEEDKRIVIEAVDSNGCDARLVIEIEVDSCNTAALKNLHAQAFRVYPNPANDLLRIENLGNDHDKIEILDMRGKVVLEKEISSPNMTIDISKLPITMYTIRVGTYYHRFIISR